MLFYLISFDNGHPLQRKVLIFFDEILSFYRFLEFLILKFSYFLIIKNDDYEIDVLHQMNTEFSSNKLMLNLVFFFKSSHL